MKLAIISDIHLIDKFDRKKFEVLESIIEGCDQIIINGDFWDGYLCTFDKFMNSEWQQLFPLLREKEAIYLYGNHDPEKKSDDRRNLFCIEAKDHHRIKTGSLYLHIEHGHEVVPAFDTKHPHIFNHRTEKIALTIDNTLKRIGMKLFGLNWFKYKNLRDIKKAKAWTDSHLKNTIFICSHIHYGEVDIKNNYANSGFIEYGYAQYLLVEDGDIELITQRY